MAMDKWTKIGAVVGGIWGLQCSWVVIPAFSSNLIYHFHLDMSDIKDLVKKD